MQPDLKQLSLLIQKIGEIEATLLEQGIECKPQPSQLSIDRHSPTALVYVDFESEARHESARISLALNYSRKKAPSKNTDTHIFARIVLHDKGGRDLLSLNFYVDDGIVKAKIDADNTRPDTSNGEEDRVRTFFEDLLTRNFLDNKQEKNLLTKMIAYYQQTQPNKKIA